MEDVRHLHRNLLPLPLIATLLSGCLDTESPARREAVRSIAVARSSPIEGTRCGSQVEAQEAFTRDTVVIADRPPFPCRLVVVPTLSLGPSEEGEHLDPGSGSVIRHPKGLVTTTHWNMGRSRGSLLLWDSEGDFIRTIGAPGDGPEEFTTTYSLDPYPGPEGSLYVNEQRRWSIFDAELEFVRTINTEGTGVGGVGHHSDALIVVDDGGFIYAGPVRDTDASMWFHQFDSLGTWTTSFAPIRNRLDAGQPTATRHITYVEGDAFWAAPPPGAPSGYVLEKWTTGGELLKVLKRDPQWMHDRVHPTAGMTLPMFRLHLDRAELLWVVGIVMKPEAEPVDAARTSSELDEEEQYEMYGRIEMWMEVIDVEAETVVASGLMLDLLDFGDGGAPPIRWIPGGREAFRAVENELGFEEIEVFEWHLVRR